jgi:glycosyltransferase involved in cell wall biosynthesis
MQGISIVIPCRNESRRLASVEERLTQLMDYLERRTGLEVQAVIEEDGSTDNTFETILAMAGRDKRILAVKGGNGRGKGGGIRLAARKCSHSIIILSDADLPVSFEDVARIARALHSYDVVLPSRRAKGSKSRNIPLARKAASYAFNKYVNLLLGLGITDTQNGVKGVRREVFDEIAPEKLGSYAMDVEMLLKARRKNLRIKEIPVEYTHERTSNFRVLRHGPAMLLDVLKLKLS